MGTLYVVATPIGNLEDITLRAIRILKEVDLILCENVSESHRLLKHYDIKTATTNYYSNSKLDKIDKIIQLLEEGKNLALISDAGTPCVSDPGSLLIDRLYKYNTGLSLNRFPQERETTQKIQVVSIPGPTAVTALYSIAGVMGNRFAFYGFAPQKKGRETFFKNILNICIKDEIPVIFYESVHRFEKCLININSAVEAAGLDRRVYKITVGRELTKMYEEIIQGDIDFVIKYFNENQDKVRGEFVVILSLAKSNIQEQYR